MTVVLLPIIATHGADGVLVVGLMAGLILIGLGYAGAGKVIRYVPIPVVEGFTIGIAIIIGLQQLPAALGVEVHAEKVLTLATLAVREWVADPTWVAPVLTATVVLAILQVSRFRPALPTSLIVVAAIAAGNSIFGWGATTIGAIPSGLPMPSLPSVPFADVSALVLPAIAVASLAALESLLSATVADGMRVGERHDSDRELFGQGIANLAVPLFGGIPPPRRSLAPRCQRASRCRLAACRLDALGGAAGRRARRGPVRRRDPAGRTVRCVDRHRHSDGEGVSVAALLRATRGDAAVLIVTAISTIVFDLVTAVLVGLIVAGFFALQQNRASGSNRRSASGRA